MKDEKKENGGEEDREIECVCKEDNEKWQKQN